jgi:fibronectin type 3 domain-containing protein
VTKGSNWRYFCIWSVVLSALCAQANTPGQHQVVLTWTASTTPSVTYNVYRGIATGVCSGTPTPYATNISPTTYTDTSVTLGTTYFYAVSAVGSGGESACSSEAQAAVPNITTGAPSGLSGTVK